MSHLYLTESGHVVPTLCEELTRYRRARKVLDLPPTAGPATLYILARPHSGSAPLHLAVNGSSVVIEPVAAARYVWYEVPLEPDWLQAGANAFELWTDTQAMNGWSLALEAGHRDPRSFLSDDSGHSWRNEHMGYLNALRGEYVVRVRLAEGENPPPPTFVWENAANERLTALRETIPPHICAPAPRLERVRALSSWLSMSWEHSSADGSLSYTPWDPFTILAWGQAQAGHHGLRPIVWCVHYGVRFVCCCQALSMPARCVALLGTPSGEDGHFVAEVWLDEFGKWAMVDPNLDAMVWRDGTPLSTHEVQALGAGMKTFLVYGPGIAFQRRNPHLTTFLERDFETGVCFSHWAIWHRADFLSHPELAPPGHGALGYCETGLVWDERDRAQGFAMFPYFATAGHFGAAP